MWDRYLKIQILHYEKVDNFYARYSNFLFESLMGERKEKKSLRKCSIIKDQNMEINLFKHTKQDLQHNK